jgi:uncharacterized protein (TIGR03083 family)
MAMTRLSFGRYCAGIVAQTGLLASSLGGADLFVAVPSCPGWTVNQLLRHLGGGQRWAAAMVRTRATEPAPDEHFRDLSGYRGEDPAVLGSWLAESAADLADALAAAGPDAPVWNLLPDSTAFCARRFTREPLIHRADAMIALGREFAATPEVAADALDEWIELGSLPQMFDYHPERRSLLGPGRTIAVRVTGDAGLLERYLRLSAFG